MFKPFQIPYQLTISDLPQVIAANNIRETNTFMLWCIYFFYNFVSSGWTNISLEGHWHFLLTIHFTSHLILRGFWNVNGYFSSGWSCIYPKGHCFDLDEGRQRKSLKRQQVITYCVVASVQVPMIAWLIKNRNNPSSFSLMDSEVILAIWKRLVSQSVQKTI